MKLSTETIAQARELANDQLNRFEFRILSSPIETLENFPWKVLQADSGNLPSSKDYAIWNRTLDPNSCLGRVAIAGALVEKYFSDSQIQAGEVLRDQLRDIMRQQVKESLPVDQQLRKEWLNELLMYELPHSIIVVDGQQFDPLSVSAGFSLKHQVKAFPFWEHVLAAMYAAQVGFPFGVDERVELLDKAEEICPGFVLLKEKRAGLLMLQGDPKGVELLKEVQEIRPVAKNLFALWAWENFPKDSQYRHALEEWYTTAMLEHLTIKNGGGYELIVGRA